MCSIRSPGHRADVLALEHHDLQHLAHRLTAPLVLEVPVDRAACVRPAAFAMQGCSLLPDSGVLKNAIEVGGVAGEGLGDVALAVGAHEVQAEMAQSGKDAAVAPYAAGVLGQRDVEHMVRPVPDGPVLAHEARELAGRDLGGAERAEVVRGRLAPREKAAPGGIDLGGAAHLDKGEEVVAPGFGAAACGQRPDPHLAALDAVAPPDVVAAGVVQRAGAAAPACARRAAAGARVRLTELTGMAGVNAG